MLPRLPLSFHPSAVLCGTQWKVPLKLTSLAAPSAQLCSMSLFEPHYSMSFQRAQQVLADYHTLSA